MSHSSFEEQLADAVDRRRLEIGHVRRVVSAVKDTPLEQAAALMAIPMLYAHWEGFVKEAVQMYIEYVESLSLEPAQANPTIFAFVLKKKVSGLVVQQSVEKMTDFATWVLSNLTIPLAFSDKTVETKSNLSFKALKEICDSLCVDVSKIEAEKKKIDGLVNRRNNVAHSGRAQNVDVSSVESDADLTLRLISTFEIILNECISTERFKRKAA